MTGVLGLSVPKAVGEESTLAVAENAVALEEDAVGPTASRKGTAIIYVTMEISSQEAVYVQ